MKLLDLGYQENKHHQTLTPFEARCVDVLTELGTGQLWAIPAGHLAIKLGLALNLDTDSGKRKLRKLINHLIIDHKIPIMCKAGQGGGYFLADSDEEVQEFCNAFRRRAMTGLLKQSQGKKAAFVDLMTQLTLDFDTPEMVEAREKLQFTKDEDPVPTFVTVVTKFLDRITGDPKKYAEEIRELQTKYGDIFVPAGWKQQLSKQIMDLQSLMGRIG